MRLNFYGGSGCGKTKAAHDFFSFAYGRNRSIKMIEEFIKMWAYQNRRPEGMEQFYVMAMQQHEEQRWLKVVPNLVSDSPIMLQCFYAKRNGFPYWQQLTDLARGWDQMEPHYNVLLDRTGLPFDPQGRYEKHLDEAQQLDRELRDFLDRFMVGKYEVIKTVELRKEFPRLEGMLV